MFIGRKRELDEIKEKLGNDRFESILIYGRRRIGKTELIKEAMKDYEGRKIYFECKKALYGDNLSAFCHLLSDIYKTNLLFTSFKDALSFIFLHSLSEKTLLVIDEFPFLYETAPIIISDIRDLIDDYKSRTNIKFIISGSTIETMKSLNDGSSETYGRFTSIIPLKPFDYYDSSFFYPDYSDEEKVLMYSCFGGVAFFNSLIDPSRSALENIKRLIVAPSSILQLEVENTVAGELGKIPLLHSLVELLARGVCKYADLNRELNSKGLKEVSPDYALKKLLEVEIAEKVVPINDKNNKKKTFYAFSDNLMEFYYRYIYRYKSQNTFLSADDFYKEWVEEDLKRSYLPRKFEAISRQFLIRKSQAHELKPLIYDIGTYYFDDAKKKINRQFDVVTLDRNGYISYECKYTNSPIDQEVIEEEERQLFSSGLDVYKLGFISKSGFAEGVDKGKYNLFSLSDFYK